MTLNSRLLSERTKAVLETIRMRLNEKQSLEYLKEVGFDIGPATFYREKRKLDKMKLQRLYHIAKIGFQDQHIDRIDNIELCLKLMWENYHRETDAWKKFQMAKDLILVQPYLSSYYEATKLVIDKQPEYQEFLDKQQEQQQQQPIKQDDKITAEFKQQIHDDDDYEEEEFNNNNNNSNAKF